MAPKLPPYFFAFTTRHNTNKDYVSISLTGIPLEGYQADSFIGRIQYQPGMAGDPTSLDAKVAYLCQSFMAGTYPTNPCEDCLREYYLWDDEEGEWWYLWQHTDGTWYDNLETYPTNTL